jgi:hypothetical protein
MNFFWRTTVGKTFKDRDKWEQKQRGAAEEERRAKFDRRRLMEQLDEEDGDTWHEMVSTDEYDDE